MKNLYLVLFLILFLPSLTSLFGQEHYAIEKLPFNTREYSEYAPVFYRNGIAFCSNRKNEVFVVHSGKNDHLPLTNIFTAARVKNQKWNSVIPFSDNLSGSFNIGPFTFSRDNKFYFTRNIPSKNSSTPDRNGIITATHSGSKILNVSLFKYNQSGYNLGHPCLSEDGKKLFFVSDMPGGYGGLDIYYCTLEKGQWSKPKNLGKRINTAGNELFPFYHSSGRLYFSSNGRKGMGGYDIYYSQQDSGEWKEPVPLEAPINSAFNDYSFIIDRNFETGYFASDRDKSDDIYSFIVTFPQFDTCDSIKKCNYCYVFYEAGSINIDTTTLRYVWDLGDGTKVKGLEAEHCFKGVGDYQVQLNVVDTLTGKIFLNEASYSFKVEDPEQAYIISSDSCLVNNPVTFTGTDKYLKDFNAIQYFWDYGDGDAAKGPVVQHVYKGPGDYKLKLGIIGQAPSTGETKKTCVFKKIVVLKNK
ncbi:MAG: PKD domain-containing protein [Bacteroidota bacterium]|nr:PKD domain-containing protein [Bacteroidota bacterium]MDP4273769.1 PKD domain-containing protein [Bacteroidota bacterium]